MGKTWIEHNTSRTALTEPNCMASIISYKDKKGKPYLFFSNPNDAKNRVNMTIKVSNDEGNSWDKLPSVLLYEQAAMGYSCLTIIDDKYIGILYEGDGDLYFQKYRLKNLSNNAKETSIHYYFLYDDYLASTIARRFLSSHCLWDGRREL